MSENTRMIIGTVAVIIFGIIDLLYLLDCIQYKIQRCRDEKSRWYTLSQASSIMSLICLILYFYFVAPLDFMVYLLFVILVWLKIFHSLIGSYCEKPTGVESFFPVKIVTRIFGYLLKNHNRRGG